MVFQMANGQMTGAFVCAETDDPDVVRGVEEALEYYNFREKTQFELEDITKAEKQLVNGINHRVIFKAHSYKKVANYLYKFRIIAVKCETLFYKTFNNKLTVINVGCKKK